MVTYTKKAIKGKRKCPNCDKLIATGFRICPKCNYNLRDANGVVPTDTVVNEHPEYTPELIPAALSPAETVRAATEFAYRMGSLRKAIDILEAMGDSFTTLRV
jgi:hypothetical protein